MRCTSERSEYTPEGVLFPREWIVLVLDHDVKKQATALAAGHVRVSVADNEGGLTINASECPSGSP